MYLLAEPLSYQCQRVGLLDKIIKNFKRATTEHSIEGSYKLRAPRDCIGHTPIKLAWPSGTVQYGPFVELESQSWVHIPSLPH